MTHHEIVTHLSLSYPSDVLIEITMERVIYAIVRRMGEEALELSTGRSGIDQGGGQGGN